jgi:predicted transcriptional regulator
MAAQLVASRVVLSSAFVSYLIRVLRHVALVRTDVSKERIATNIKVTKIGELRTPLAVSSNRSTLRRNTV